MVLVRADAATAGREASMGGRTVVFGAAFVDTFGMAVMLPLLPIAAADFGGGVALAGAMTVAYGVGQFVSAPFWGRASDRGDRSRVLAAGLLVSSVSCAIAALATAPGALVALRGLGGIGAGIAGVFSAVVADRTSPDQRVRALGWLTAVTSAGMMVGSSVGPLAGSARWQTALVVASVTYLLAAIAALRSTVGSAKSGSHANQAARPSSGARRTAPVRTLVDLVKSPLAPASQLIWLHALAMCAYTVAWGVLPLLLPRAGLNAGQVGLVFTGIGAMSVLARIFLLDRVVRGLGERGAMLTGASMLTGGLVAAGSMVPGVLLAALLVIPIGPALMFPSMTALLSRATAPGRLGETMGAQQFVGGVSRVIGPATGMWLFSQSGPAAPIVAAAAAAAALTVILTTAPLLRPTCACRGECRCGCDHEARLARCGCLPAFC